jgi:polar amino acid transport system substrate-binding protein
MTRRNLILLGTASVLASCQPAATGPKPLRVGMELSTPPFEMQGADGKPDGTSVRLAEGLAAKLGRPLQLEVMSFAALITALRTDTPERRQTIDFSDPYCKIGLALLAAKSSPVTAAADLNAAGRKIIVRLKTTAEQFARKNYPLAEIMPIDSESAALLEIVNGRADVFIYDQLSVLRFHLAQPASTRALLQPLQQDAWAMAIRQGETELKGQINSFLQEFRTTGGFQKLTQQYLAKEKSALQEQGVPFIFE